MLLFIDLKRHINTIINNISTGVYAIYIEKSSYAQIYTHYPQKKEYIYNEFMWVKCLFIWG